MKKTRKQARAERQVAATWIERWRRENLGRKRRNLEELRLGRGHLGYIRGFRHGVDLGWYTLREIGTSEEELTQLERARWMQIAKASLAKLRQGKDDLSWLYTYRIRRAKSECGITLEEIGTSREELDALLRPPVEPHREHSAICALCPFHTRQTS